MVDVPVHQQGRIRAPQPAEFGAVQYLLAGLAQPRTRRHAHAVGERQKLGHLPGGPGARGADPGGDRHRRVGDGPRHGRQFRRVDNGSPAVDPEDNGQDVATGRRGVVNPIDNEIGEHGVHQADNFDD